MMRSSLAYKWQPKEGSATETQISAPTGVAAPPLSWLFAVYKQLGRYSVVSTSALSTDILIYMALVYFGIRAALAGIIGYAIGMLLHFVLSCRYVFDAELTAKSEGRLFSEFAISGGVGLILTASLIWLMTEVINQGPAVAKVIAAGVSFLAVFMIRRSVVFVKTPPFTRSMRASSPPIALKWHGESRSCSLDP